MTTVQKVTVGARGATNTTPMVAKGAIFPAREKGGRRRNGGTHQIGHTALPAVCLWVLKWADRSGKGGRAAVNKRGRRGGTPAHWHTLRGDQPVEPLSQEEQ